MIITTKLSDIVGEFIIKELSNDFSNRLRYSPMFAFGIIIKQFEKFIVYSCHNWIIHFVTFELSFIDYNVTLIM